MQLIYRGQTFNYTPAPAPSNRRPRAVNWRYQVEGDSIGEMSAPSAKSACSLAINWRYRAIVAG
jgi:hypothetical protein